MAPMLSIAFSRGPPDGKGVGLRRVTEPRPIRNGAVTICVIYKTVFLVYQ